MHQCPTCGKQLDDGVRFCPDDGTPLTDTAAATSARTPVGNRGSSQPIDLPTVVGGRYRLVEYRGGGGMAKVYRAVDQTLEREVAVKLINPELRQDPEFDARFQREARIASQLSDPHIIVVHDFGIDPQHGPFLVMEYLRGQSVRERLQAEGPLPYKAAVQLSGQLLLALIHAHDRGIVHRDIKPDNVFLLSQSGVRLHVRVLDFGIARIYRPEGAGSHETLTQPGAVLGTPRYMSPEQLAGQPLDVRSDLYTTAMVIHEALTGQLPYISGKKLCEMCPEAPQALQDLLDQCLKPNPNERPRSAVEVYVRLQELGKASGILLLQPGALDKLIAARQTTAVGTTSEPTTLYQPQAQPTPSRRRRWLFAGTAALGLLLIAGIIAAVWYSRRGPGGTPANESLLGISIGAERDSVVATLGQAPQAVRPGNPFEPGQGDLRPVGLGHVLVPADLEAGEGGPNNLQLLSWSESEVRVVLLGDRVRAVVVRSPHRAATARGVRVGDSLAQLERAYPEKPSIDTFSIQPTEAKAHAPIPRMSSMLFASAAEGSLLVSKPPRRWGKVYRYDALGIGFELLDEKITAIALYPPKSP